MIHPFLIAKRKRFNITTLHDANLRKLARVVPALLELETAVTVQNANGMQLSLRILETSKYTKPFHYTCSTQSNSSGYPACT